MAGQTGTPIASERLPGEETLAILSIVSAVLIAFALRTAGQSGYGHGQQEGRTTDE
jgi:hypothetical protein